MPSAQCAACCTSCLALVTLLLVPCTAMEILYKTMEQRPRGTLIGDIKSSAKFKERLPSSEYKTLRFSFLPKDDPSSTFLRIKESTGEIFSNIALDREKICDPADENCIVSFKVAVLSDSGGTFEVISINIQIEDINDKYPVFPQNHVTLEIPENTKDSYEIRAAIDDDAGINSVQTYTIEPWDGPFELKEEKQPGGNTKLSILLKDMLDREVKDSYSLRVIARDGGSPMRTGEMLVDVTVTDANDHPPVFTQSEYMVSKAENATVGTPLVNILAKDADLGVNGQVRYRFVGKISDMFTLNETSGLVVLAKMLDFESQSRYSLTVEARDMGVPAQTSQALVIVSVIDVNDDPPKIAFNLLNKGTYAEIPEDAVPGRFVAHVSIYDGDSGENGEVYCRLDTNMFKLQSMGKKDFEIKLNGQLDRESKDEYKVNMFCADGGIPPLTDSKEFTVRVKDVNDHSPEFKQTVYAVTIEENNKMDVSVVDVSATDKDIGENGRIVYELSGDADGLFAVDRNTGRITALDSLDREKNPEVVFQVIAKDRGIPRLIDSATVSVTVLDKNDEAPSFKQPEYTFQILENEEPGSIVGSVFATDPDTGLGGDVIYFILPKSDPKNLFSISTTEGTITINEKLDREVRSQHNLIVRARDKGDPSLNSTVQVTVLVGDVNDNSPRFIFPNSYNNTVEILHTLPVYTPVATLKATDADEGRNAETTYYIEDGNSKTLFVLNDGTGELTLRRRLRKKDSGNYALLVAAQNTGDSEKITRRLLHIKVIQDNETASGAVPGSGVLPGSAVDRSQMSNVSRPANGEESNTMMIIVICVVVATVVISVVLIASICIVLRKRDSRRPNYFVKPEEQKIMKQKESPSSTLSGKIPPPSSPNESDDNNLRKKEVSFSLEEVPQECHNLTNSTHNTSFSTFKGQQASSASPSPSPTEHPVPGMLKGPGSRQASPAKHSPVMDSRQDYHPHQGSLPHKDPSWGQKKPIEVKQLLELLHKDDAHSDTSGETFNSDSGRGGSEDDGHVTRGQHYPQTEPDQPRYYATKYTPCVNGPMDGSRSRRIDVGRKPGSPNGYTRFKTSGCPVPKLDLNAREFPAHSGCAEDGGDAQKCSSFRHPNYTTFKSATLPGATPSPLASPLSCGSGCNLVAAAGEGYYHNSGVSSQSHSLERNKPHSPMFKVKAPGWEPVSKTLDYPPPPPYPDVVNSHDYGFDEGIGESMAYCREDDDTTTSGSYTVNADDVCDDINQLYFTDVVV